MAANEVRRKKTDPRVAVTRSIATLITRIFAPSIAPFARFTAAWREGRVHPSSRVDLPEDRRDARIGRNGVLLQGGLHPDLAGSEFYENMAAFHPRSATRGSTCTVLRA